MEEDEREEYKVEKARIEEQVKEWVENNLKGFSFRKFQKEAIVNILDKIVNRKNENIICEAPTGSGKSIINIISSQVLWEYYQIDSYILCSDLYLFDQYEKFVKQNPQLLNIAAIKGQTGNYKCLLSNDDIRNADCQMAGLSWFSLMNQLPIAMKAGYKCCKACEYVIARKRALLAPVTITTYQNFLFQINIMYAQHGGDESAKGKCLIPRKVIFCDEAHNMPSVVQLKYTPEIRNSDFQKFINVINYYNNMLNDPNWEYYCDAMMSARTDCAAEFYLDLEKLNDVPEGEEYEEPFDIHDASVVKEELDKIWVVLSAEKPALEDIYASLTIFHFILAKLSQMANVINFYVKQHKQSRYEKLEKDMLGIWKTNVWLANYCCSFNDFMNAIKLCGKEYLLKQVLKEKPKKEDYSKTLFFEDEYPLVVTLNCLKEDVLVFCGLLKWAQFRVFTSATIGGKENFEENNGVHYTNDEFASFDRVPSIFDFTKSPINCLTRHKMSYKERNENLPKIGKYVNSLLSRHKNEKGIIQTGSYDLAKKLMPYLSDENKSRLLTYQGSKEKIKIAEMHRTSQNTVLIGPSLNQGIDLPDENVRFIIILKVPYPGLADEYTKRKIKLFPKWYEAVTATEIIQGIGRGVRNENDWCVTYILDACFQNLYFNTIDQFSEEMRNRIKFFA